MSVQYLLNGYKEYLEVIEDSQQMFHRKSSQIYTLIEKMRRLNALEGEKMEEEVNARLLVLNQVKQYCNNQIEQLELKEEL